MPIRLQKFSMLLVAVALLSATAFLAGCAGSGYDLARLEADRASAARTAPLPIWEHIARNSGGE